MLTRIQSALKPLYLGLGIIFVGLGLLGVFLPVLPTTPFMILALWMFAKSSRRFHDWLFHHRLFGPPLKQWQSDRVIPLKAKIFAISMMALSMGYLLLYSSVPRWGIASAGGIMCFAAWFILSKPSSMAK